jgi:hypothetical protein
MADNADLKLDVKAMLIDLSNKLNQDFTILDDDELTKQLNIIVYAEEKLVFNLVDWSLSKLHLLSPKGLKGVTDIRDNLVSMSPDALHQIDPMAPMVLDVVHKLDALDSSRRLGDILLRVMSI